MFYKLSDNIVHFPQKKFQEKNNILLFYSFIIHLKGEKLASEKNTIQGGPKKSDHF